MSCKKVGHATRNGAIIAAQKMEVVGMNVYLCPRCSKWHCGRSRKSRSPEALADRIGVVLARHERRLLKRTAVR